MIPPTGVTFDALPGLHSSLWCVLCFFFVMKNDGSLDVASSVASLYSQPGVMSMPRALKLTLIAALKIITKQQEAADVLGQCRLVEDRVMFREIYSSGQTSQKL